MNSLPVVSPVPTPVAAADPEVAVVKVEPVRPKRSCRGDDPTPVVKPKRPRKPVSRVGGKRKKKGGWRGGKQSKELRLSRKVIS